MLGIFLHPVIVYFKLKEISDTREKKLHSPRVFGKESLPSDLARSRYLHSTCKCTELDCIMHYLPLLVTRQKEEFTFSVV